MSLYHRRQVLIAGAAALSWGIAGLLAPRHSLAAETFEVAHTEAEWRKLLSPNAYAVLREEATEKPGSSPLNDEHRPGRFICAGCELELFSSKTKFDSRTGWPSFWKPLEKAVGQRMDRTFGMARIEVHCRGCGGHLGHLFNDAPPPTGLRYCMNGYAMRFVPGAA